jgi:outer membrane protein assembly factor BamB
VLHGQWSSVAITEVKRPDGSVQPLVIAPLGDGWVYAYDARDGKLVWKFDSNPKESVYPQTRNELISTPVIWENRMYIANGQDPEHGTGYAHLWCVDITKTGDVSPEISQAPKPKVGEELVAPKEQVANRKGQPNPNSGVVWHYYTQDDNGDGKIQDNERFHRSIGTVAISAEGLLFATDFNGYVHCMDARSGKHHWAYDMEADMWASPLLVDGKVYATDGDGDVAIFNAAKDAKEPITTINMAASVYGTPVMANGTLYIMSMHKLFAIGPKQ